jgi:PST family polysaccharide transporter
MAGAVGVAAYVAMVACAAVFLGNGSDQVVLVAIIGASLLISPLRTIGYWFEATLQAKYLAIAGTAAVVTSTIARIGVVVAGGGLRALAACIAIEQLLVGVLTTVSYLRHPQRVRRWRMRLEVVRVQLRESLPLVITAVASAVYMRIDQVMLGSLSTEREAGLYAAVVRLSEAAIFVAMSVASSFAPSVARLRRTDPERYEHQVTRMMTLLSGIALAYAVPVALLSPVIVSVLLGSKFDGAAPILTVHVLSSLFVFLTYGQAVWTVNESLQRWAMIRTVTGALLNIALNFVLIPPFGALGAAYATFVAYAWSGWIGNLLSPSTRPMFWIEVRALDPRRIVRVGLGELRTLAHR